MGKNRKPYLHITYLNFWMKRIAAFEWHESMPTMLETQVIQFDRRIFGCLQNVNLISVSVLLGLIHRIYSVSISWKLLNQFSTAYFDCGFGCGKMESTFSSILIIVFGKGGTLFNRFFYFLPYLQQSLLLVTSTFGVQHTHNRTFYNWKVARRDTNHSNYNL